MRRWLAFGLRLLAEQIDPGASAPRVSYDCSPLDPLSVAPLASPLTDREREARAAGLRGPKHVR